jgi:hypothetical protein
VKRLNKRFRISQEKKTGTGILFAAPPTYQLREEKKEGTAKKWSQHQVSGAKIVCPKMVGTSPLHFRYISSFSMKHAYTFHQYLSTLTLTARSHDVPIATA